MHWYDYVLQFLSGVLAANGVPHFYHGVLGRRFQTPFAKPPGVGESSAGVNVLWGLANFIVAGVLLARHLPAGGEVVIGWGLFAIGAIFSGVMLARYFAKVRA